MEKRRPGTVLTFYSYKGGVGRTMALANVATLLARWGRRVLVVDFDLEAPGLERYFAALPKDAARTERPGVVDMLLSLQDRRPCLWQDALIRLDIDGGRGCLHLISAGRDDGAYIRRAQSLNYDVLFADETLRFGDALIDLRRQWQQEYDYVLIDSRTGISDIGGICTILFPDVLVLLFTANDQSVQGCADVIRRAKLAQENLPEDRWRLRALPLLSRDERRAEFEQSEQWRPRIAEHMSEFFSDWLSQDVSAKAVLDTLYLPQVAYWSFGERLPVYERPSDINDSGSLAAAYAKLGRLIDSGLDWACVEMSDSAYQVEWRERQLRELEGAFEDATTPGERVAILAEVVTCHHELYGPDDPRTLGVIYRHADQCLRSNDPGMARVLLEDLFYRSRRILGASAPQTVRSQALLRQALGLLGDRQALNSLLRDMEVSAAKSADGDKIIAEKRGVAKSYYERGEYRKAGEVWKEVLELSQRSVGPDHPTTLTCMNDLASTLQAQGDLVGARALQEQVLEGRRRILGRDHHDTLTSMNDLASTLYGQGDLNGAREVQEEVLISSRRILGPDHPDTLTAMNNLASTLYGQGELAYARTLEEEVLDSRRRILGPDHPDTLTSINNLASTLFALGDLGEAQMLEEEVLEARRRILGPDHPHTLISMNNLADTLRAQGELARAMALEEGVLEGRRRVLGSDHPDTLTSIANLAGTLFVQGDLLRAKALGEQVLEARRRVLGPDHPDTISSMNCLADTLHAQGDLIGAKILQKEALEVIGHVLGPSHPYTLNGMRNLAEILRKVGDLDGVRALEEQIERVGGHGIEK